MSSAAQTIADAFNFELPERPYPGLRPFAKEEWPIFFGRERMVDEIVDRLMEICLLVVHGDSGCGKSSLIRAGVLPRLEQQFARGGSGWITCTTTPGHDPLGNLAHALAGIDGPDEDESRRHEIRRALNCGRDGAKSLVELLCGKRDDHLCLLLDQFEELFAHARHQGPQQACILIDLLIGLHELKDSRLRVVLTMRSEFLGACAQYEGFAQAVNATQYLLPRMERADLMRAIQEPAFLYDGEIAPDLAERLINDAGASQDQLPLIQHALMRLHRKHAAKAGQPWRLTAQDYPPTGGLAQLLSDHADEVASAVEPNPSSGKNFVEEIFRALTEINADHQAIRRPQTLFELQQVCAAPPGTLEKIIDAFRAEGVSFLRPYGLKPLKPADSIDISHEALIRCWAKIEDEKFGWLAKEFEDGLIWSSLLVQCKCFDEDPKNVLSAATTEERQEWLGGRSEAWAQRYGGGWGRVQKLIAASVEARTEQLDAENKARRVKRITGALVAISIFSAATIALAIFAMKQRDQMNRARTIAEVARENANAERDKAIDRYNATNKALEQLKLDLAELKRAAAKSPADSDINYSIQQADQSVSRINAINQAREQIIPRIYIHISDPAQRKAARIVELGIEAGNIGGVPIIVPGIQLVKPVPKTILRCFIAADCQRWGQRLLDLVNKQLRSPQAVLDDFSATYTDTGAIRQAHFELYFAPGDVVPSASAPPASRY